MKKKNFLSGFGAKLALAAVALTTMVFTSCEEESISVKPIELPNATASLVISAYSLDNGSQLVDPSIQTIAAGANGAIAAQTVTVAAPSVAGYLKANDIKVAVPAVAKGQSISIPVNFYLQSELGAAKNPLAVEVEKEQITSETTEASTFTNNEDTDKLMDAFFWAKNGQEVTNLAEVNKYIDAYVADTRAFSNAEIRAVLKALINSYNTGFKAEKTPCRIVVPANGTVTLNPTTEMFNVVYSITTTIEGVQYTIPNVQVKKAGATTYKETSDSHAGHGHGHGNNGNAGGGSAGK